MPKTRSFRWVYAVLWLIRVWFALYGTGYIHPDEHLQNGEVTAGDILGFHALTTWEWSSETPVRSILPVFVTTGLPWFILRLLFGPERLSRMIHPSFVFRTQRLIFLCLSSVLDCSVSSLVSPLASCRMCLLLLASSYVTWTFQVRPFSNALESALVALCLVLLRQMVDEWTHLKVTRKNAGDGRPHHTYALKRDLHLFAVLVVIGTFTRPTFVAFVFPIACQILWLSYQVASSPIRTINLLLLPLCTAMLVISIFITADTYYFSGDFSKLVITPYNFVKYNLSASNLADHGLHPHWLHVGVNLPMLLGPLFIWFAWRSVYEYVRHSGGRAHKVHFETDIIRQTLIQVIILSLSVLSVQPHQEPRFLIPLILPFIVLAATVESPRLGKLFWVIWITFNLVLALLFGVLHQGGVIPSLLSLHSTLGNAVTTSRTHVVYWKTYMPPRYLLGVFQQDVESGNVAFVDLSGAPQDELVTALSAPSFNQTYFATPVPMYLTLPQLVSSCMTLQERVFPHLDLDHIPESVQAGVYDGLSLGVYIVDSGCVGRTGTQVT